MHAVAKCFPALLLQLVLANTHTANTTSGLKGSELGQQLGSYEASWLSGCFSAGAIPPFSDLLLNQLPTFPYIALL